MSTETVRTIRDGEPRTSASFFTQLPSSNICGCFAVSWYFLSTEAIKLIRDGEPRTSTSTFTQLMSSEMCGSFSVSLCFTSTETARLIREGGDMGYGGGVRGRSYACRYTVTTRMSPVLGRAAMRAILIFH